MRSHSITTWTRFCPFLTTYLRLRGHSLLEHGHKWIFLDHLPTSHVVIERPLRNKFKTKCVTGQNIYLQRNQQQKLINHSFVSVNCGGKNFIPFLLGCWLVYLHVMFMNRWAGPLRLFCWLTSVDYLRKMYQILTYICTTKFKQTKMLIKNGTTNFESHLSYEFSSLAIDGNLSQSKNTKN